MLCWNVSLWRFFVSIHAIGVLGSGSTGFIQNVVSPPTLTLSRLQWDSRQWKSVYGVDLYTALRLRCNADGVQQWFLGLNWNIPVKIKDKPLMSRKFYHRQQCIICYNEPTFNYVLISLILTLKAKCKPNISSLILLFALVREVFLVPVRTHSNLRLNANKSTISTRTNSLL